MEPDTEDTVQEEMSTRDVAAAAFEAFEEREEEAPEAQEAAEEPQEPQEATEEAPEAQEAPEEAPEAQEAPEEAQEAPEAVVEAPEHWSASDKEAFNDIPDNSKQWFLDKTKELERGYSRKFEDAADAVKEHERLSEVFKPFEQELIESGINRTTAVARLVAAHHALRTHPVQALARLAGQYAGQATPVQRKQIIDEVSRSLGVEPASADPEGEDEWLDPLAKNKIDQLEAQLQQVTGTIQQAGQSQQQQLRQAYVDHINQVRTAVDESGNLKYPYFDDERVQAKMGSLLKAKEAVDLLDAYDQAVHANPETRKALLEASSRTLTGQRKVENAKAKRAGGSVRSKASPAAGNADDGPVLSVRETTMRAAEAALSTS